MSYFCVDHEIYRNLRGLDRFLYIEILARTNYSNPNYEKWGMAVEIGTCLVQLKDLCHSLDIQHRSTILRTMRRLQNLNLISFESVPVSLGNGRKASKIRCYSECNGKTLGPHGLNARPATANATVNTSTQEDYSSARAREDNQKAYRQYLKNNPSTPPPQSEIDKIRTILAQA